MIEIVGSSIGNGASASPPPPSSSSPWSVAAEIGSAAINAAAALLLAKWHLITGMEALVALGLTGLSMDPVAAAKRLLQGRNNP